ncbi:putative FBD-associated F-box protein At1g61330 [Telopea speciosissima]|uniref:putative FBD-associated F-box protein At1g61330 n=1 Tax=Telopea speciosissima TaxID=54955 RepID=UPI001CC5FC89|nr:putative FBD-associated F-box protein At1g61330 [Telopea speciosissima]
MEEEDMQQQESSPKRIKRRQDDGFRSRSRSRGIVTLSDDILEYIFSYLSIKLAIKIGTLSSRFRNSWIYSRNLDFDEEFAEGQSREEFIRIVDRVLKLHMGRKVCRFRLFFDPSEKVLQVDEWIRFAAMKGVEEVDLDFSAGSERILIYKIPDFLLDCGSVMVLKLTLCEFMPPLISFNGFGSLTTLSLSRVDVTDQILHSVFQTCLLLENLDLNKCLELDNLRISARNLRRFKKLKITDCKNLYCLKIDAPTLHSLHYSGNGKLMFSFGSTSNLKDAMLDFTVSMFRGFGETLYMENLPFKLVHVKILTVSSIFLQGLSPKYVNGELKAIQFCLHNLKEFQLLMETVSYCNPYDIALFLKNCPWLERIFIDLKGFSFYHGIYWELHAKQPLAQLGCKFQHLKSVKLNGFKFEELEMLLVKFVLEKAIVLETLFLVPDKNQYKITYTGDMQIGISREVQMGSSRIGKDLGKVWPELGNALGPDCEIEIGSIVAGPVLGERDQTSSPALEVDEVEAEDRENQGSADHGDQV